MPAETPERAPDSEAFNKGGRQSVHKSKQHDTTQADYLRAEHPVALVIAPNSYLKALSESPKSEAKKPLESGILAVEAKKPSKRGFRVADYKKPLESGILAVEAKKPSKSDFKTSKKNPIIIKQDLVGLKRQMEREYKKSRGKFHTIVLNPSALRRSWYWFTGRKIIPMWDVKHIKKYERIRPLTLKIHGSMATPVKRRYLTGSRKPEAVSSELPLGISLFSTASPKEKYPEIRAHQKVDFPQILPSIPKGLRTLVAPRDATYTWQELSQWQVNWTSSDVPTFFSPSKHVCLYKLSRYRDERNSGIKKKRPPRTRFAVKKYLGPYRKKLRLRKTNVQIYHVDSHKKYLAPSRKKLRLRKTNVQIYHVDSHNVKKSYSPDRCKPPYALFVHSPASPLMIRMVYGHSGDA